MHWFKYIDFKIYIFKNEALYFSDSSWADFTFLLTFYWGVLQNKDEMAVIASVLLLWFQIKERPLFSLWLGYYREWLVSECGL